MMEPIFYPLLKSLIITSFPVNVFSLKDALLFIAFVSDLVRIEMRFLVFRCPYSQQRTLKNISIE
jgi:hypothetical protein